jgi:hypothetical protein
MYTACPVVESYLAQVRKYMEESTVLTIDAYSRELNYIEELLELQRFSNTRARQHLRAFLCVEWMLYRLPVGLPSGTAQQLAMSPWERSREGLTNLIEMLRGDNEELLGVMTEHTFSLGMVLQPDDPAAVPVRVGDGADQIYQNNRKLLQHVYRYAGESAVILRQSLRNPNVRLTRVGTRLAKAAHVARTGMQGLIELAEILLSQSERFAARAWEIHRT